MRKIIMGLGGLLVLIIAAAFLLPLLIPAETFKGKIEEAASKALARDVQIASVDKISILPNPAFQVSGLKVANAPDMSAQTFASVEGADIGVKLLPLIGKKVEITRFVLDSPEINLEKNKKGEVNWLLGTPTTVEKPEDGDAVPVSDLRLGTLVINEGAITYRDGVAGKRYEARDANMTIGMDSLKKPLRIDGTMSFQGRPTKVNAELSTPNAFLTYQDTSFSLNGDVAGNEFSTTMALPARDKETPLTYQGDIKIDAPELRVLLSTFGTEIPASNGFNKLAMNGAVNGTPDGATLNLTAVSFDEITGQGDLQFKWAGKKPSLKGDLTFGMLDLTPYLPAPTAEQEKAKADVKAAFPAWSEAPLDFSALTVMDVALKSTTDGIRLPSMAFDKSALNINIDNGELTAELESLTLYNGEGSGTLKVNGRYKRPTLAANFKLGKLNAQSFAKDVLGMHRVAGIGGLNFDVATRGDTQAALIRAMDGQGSFSLLDGALEGINIGKIVRSADKLIRGFEDGKLNVDALTSAIAEAKGDSQSTDFASLTSDFALENGVMTTDSILMTGPYFVITGEGKVNLAKQTMSIDLTPVLTDMAEEDARKRVIAPIAISGSFSQPKISIDTKKIVQEATSGKIKDILGQNGVNVGDGESVEDAIKNEAANRLGGLLGLNDKKKEESPKAPAEAPAEESAPETASPTPAETAAPEVDTSVEETETEEAPEEELSTEDVLKKKALESIFGSGD